SGSSISEFFLLALAGTRQLAAPALLALPGHLPVCPPGQWPHQHSCSLQPPPAHPHVFLPCQPFHPRPGPRLHYSPQSHGKCPLEHQGHLLCRMCCTGLSVCLFCLSRVLSPHHHGL
ncbi:hypothetical protein CIB84_015884, partial [Bambusicola thoracicus]